MKWQLDPAHTNVTVAVRHMAISTVPGRFTSGADGTIDYDPQAPDRAQVELRIKAASIDTGDAKRDGHLRSPDFLDAEKHPEITFKSTRIERKGDNDWLARGDLTIRGVTKPVEVNVETLGVVEDPYVKQRVGFDAATTIDRRDWGLVWNMPVPSGLLVGNQVKIEFSVEAIPEQTPAADRAANAYKKLGVHGAAAAVRAHRDAHFYLRDPRRFRAHPRAPGAESRDISRAQRWASRCAMMNAANREG